MKVEEKKEQKSSKREVSGNMDDGADDDRDSTGLSQQSSREQSDNQQPSDEINENTLIFEKKVKTKPKDKINENTVFLMSDMITISLISIFHQRLKKRRSRKPVKGRCQETCMMVLMTVAVLD